MAPIKRSSSKTISYPMPLAASAGQKAAPVHTSYTSVHATHTTAHDGNDDVNFPAKQAPNATSHRLRKRGRDSEASTPEDETPRSRQRTSSLLSGTIRKAPATIASVLSAVRPRSNSKSKENVPATRPRETARPVSDFLLPKPEVSAPRSRRGSDASMWSLETVHDDQQTRRRRADSDVSISTLRGVARPRAPTPQTMSPSHSPRSARPGDTLRAGTPCPLERATPQPTLKRVRGSISDRDTSDADSDDATNKRVRVKRDAAFERRRCDSDASTASDDSVYLAYGAPVMPTRPAEFEKARKTAPLPERNARPRPTIATETPRRRSAEEPRRRSSEEPEARRRSSEESTPRRRSSVEPEVSPLARSTTSTSTASPRSSLESEPTRFRDAHDLVHLAASDYNMDIVFLRAPINANPHGRDEISVESAFHLTLKDEERWLTTGLAPPDIKHIDIRCYSKTHGSRSELSKRWTCQPTGYKLYDCRMHDGIMVDSDWRRTNLYDPEHPAALPWQNVRGWAKPVIVSFPASWFVRGQSRVFVLDVVTSFGHGKEEVLRAKADITVGNLKWETVKAA
ncbi:uncharacterized protein SCHCODRAFT_02604994 [Schizophyllum commune H4-8]|uniref:uncharacterized protein n=1 Tax=Schizophyllum commune (strain H4-8 / FGSC 9210) TaxID=578458 RepID=UPI00215E3873|nr:uncharacterized protein SCHCODRAFT_02604994 [Schizophyllum commune H4-8]KAI5899383.1 hypothetical protein SCHCODRAFT_02604994 [Schizophyllum commune H4-8]